MGTKVASEDVADATCAAPYYTCAGRSQSGFLPKALPCCKAGYDCVPWGEDFSQCRETAYAKCSKDGEWCYNTEGSTSPRRRAATRPCRASRTTSTRTRASERRERCDGHDAHDATRAQARVRR